MLIPFVVSLSVLLTTVQLGDSAESRAHHKVPNLALYPERQSWCQVTPIRQEVAHPPDCTPHTIDNSVCLGACFSYSVPRAQDDAAIPPYCDACRPTRSSWTVVTLNCTRPETGESYQLARNVELISNCSCVDCSASPIDSSLEGEEDGLVESNEILDGTESKDESPDTLETNDLEEDVNDGESEEEAEVIPSQTLFDGSNTLYKYKLKSVSEEDLKDLHTQRDEEMIKNNKIKPDDDLVDLPEPIKSLRSNAVRN